MTWRDYDHIDARRKGEADARWNTYPDYQMEHEARHDRESDGYAYMRAFEEAKEERQREERRREEQEAEERATARRARERQEAADREYWEYLERLEAEQEQEPEPERFPFAALVAALRAEVADLRAQLTGAEQRGAERERKVILVLLEERAQHARNLGVDRFAEMLTNIVTYIDGERHLYPQAAHPLPPEKP